MAMANGDGSTQGWRRAYGAGWVVLALVLCFPVGLVLVWTHPRWNRRTQWIATGALAVLLVAAAVSDGEPEGSEQVSTQAVATTLRTTTTERRITTTTAPPTTTTTRPPTTTTTRPPTTTTAATTTAPPTTAPPPPPPTVVAAPLTSSSCDPNYSGCVPIASDVDCEGGKGNGPAYTGRVEVLGSDIYGLDGDGDGIGCDNS